MKNDAINEKEPHGQPLPAEEQKRKEAAAKRIKEALKLRNMKAIDLANTTGISKASISGYMHGRYEPKAGRTYLMAKALDVSESWLMGYDVPMEQAKTTNKRTKKEQKTQELLSAASQNENLLETVKSFLQVPEDKQQDIALEIKTLSSRYTKELNHKDFIKMVGDYAALRRHVPCDEKHGYRHFDETIERLMCPEVCEHTQKMQSGDVLVKLINGIDMTPDIEECCSSDPYFPLLMDILAMVDGENKYSESNKETLFIFYRGAAADLALLALSIPYVKAVREHIEDTEFAAFISDVVAYHIEDYVRPSYNSSLLPEHFLIEPFRFTAEPELNQDPPDITASVVHTAHGWILSRRQSPPSQQK